MRAVFFWIKTAAVFVLRSGRTTAALGAVICIAVAVLIFVTSVATGVNDCMIKNSTGLYGGQISGTGLPASLDPESLKVPGVSAVLRRIPVQGVISRRGQDSADPGMPLTLVVLDPEREKETCFFWKKLVSGTWLAPDKNGILISRKASDILGVQPGDSLWFRSPEMGKIAFVVTGIFDTGMSAMDGRLAFCPGSVLQGKAASWSAAVFLLPGVSETAVRSAWAEMGVDVSRFRTWQEAMPDLTQLIDLNRISMGFVMALVLAVVAFATATAFAIAIISHLREYGIMKAMGISAGETALLICSQVMLLNVLAAAGGMLLGILAVFIGAGTGIDLSGFTSHNPYFVVSGVITPRLTPFSLLLPPGLGLGFCLAAAVWPVLLVIRRGPSQILRSI